MSYPAELSLDAPLEVARWRPLVNWLLAIPHLLIASALNSLGGVIALVSWFIIVFTGSLPQSLAAIQCLIIRYQIRTFGYALWLHERYPDFDFSMTEQDPGGDPLRFDVEPQLVNRNQLTVGLRFFWIIPIGLFMLIMHLVGSVVMFVAFFIVLFTGRWPEGLRHLLVGVGRLTVRVGAYGYLLIDEYPPFSLD